MRIFGVLVICFTVVYFHGVESKASMDQIKTILNKLKVSCQKNTGVSDELIEGTHEGKFPEDRSLMCFQKCLLQSMNMIKNNKINDSAISKQIGVMMADDIAQKMVNVVRVCILQATSEDICEQAYQFVKCWWNTDSSVYLFP